MAQSTRQTDSDHVDTWLAEFVLGTLPDREREQVTAHLFVCSRCDGEFAQVAEAMSALSLSLQKVAPRPECRAGLLAAFAREHAAAQEPAAWEPIKADDDAGLLSRLAQFFDLALLRAQAVLAAAVEPSSFGPGLIPGMALFHLQGGPAVAGADTGLVRLDAGLHFPRHRHLGEERILVLSGSYRDEDGQVLGPGQGRTLPAGSDHRFEVLPGAPCVFAAVVFGGIEILSPGP